MNLVDKSFILWIALLLFYTSLGVGAILLFKIKGGPLGFLLGMVVVALTIITHEAWWSWKH